MENVRHCVTVRSEAQVGIIGGGYAGMAAAVTLAENGVPVSVFEAMDVLGGRARKVEHRGLALDNGCHILIGAYRETLRLISLAAGNHSGLLRSRFRWDIAGHFRLRSLPLPRPLNLLSGLFFARGASAREKLRAARFIANGNVSGRDISVDQLLEQHDQGKNIVRFFWRPLCVSALNTPIEEASATTFLRVLRAVLDGGGDSDLVISRENLSDLFPEPAARYIEKRNGTVYRKCRVKTMRAAQAGFALETECGNFRFDRVICALPPYSVAALVAGFPQLSAIARTIERLEYQPIYSIYLQYPKTPRLDFPMLGLSGEPGQWVFDRGRLCQQEGLLAVVISAQGAHQELAHDELASRVHLQLQSELGELPRPLWSKVIAEKRATISCVPELARPPRRTPLADFFLAGDYTESEFPATIESAVQSGVDCARLILETSPLRQENGAD